MRNFLPTFSPAYASAMRRGFLRLRGFCALSPVAQAAAFRPAAVSPAPTFFAVRRFVRFIQPAPNPALKRTCAKSRAARLALRSASPPRDRTGYSDALLPIFFRCFRPVLCSQTVAEVSMASIPS